MPESLNHGINWIDTAAVYGLGHSEEVVGRLLRDWPMCNRPYVFTKCGLIWDSNNPMKEPRRVLKPDSIRRECEASLRRLGIERIDLYQFHWPDDTGTPIEDSWSEMIKLVKEGKVRAAGVSNFNIELLERCEHIRLIGSDRLDACVAGRDGSNRGSAHAGSSGRLDSSCIPRAHGRGYARNCIRNQTDKSRCGPNSPEGKEGFRKWAIRVGANLHRFLVDRYLRISRSPSFYALVPGGDAWRTQWY